MWEQVYGYRRGTFSAGLARAIGRMALGAVLCLPPFTAAGDQQSFGDHIRALYGFSPHKLDEAQIDAKSAALDEFWTMVAEDPKEYLPWLRAELARDGNPAFFYYDGGKLLLNHGKSSADKRLVLSAIPRSDLRDIQPTDYLITVQRLAAEGFDTSAAAFRILDYPDFKTFIVQHALTLGQDYSFVYMLLPTKQEYYLGKAVARLRKESDATALVSLLKLLWYADTGEADAAIQWASAAGQLPGNVRKMASSMVTAREKAMRSGKGGSAADYDALRLKRRKRMRSVSDEALLELDSMTRRMKEMRK